MKTKILLLLPFLLTACHRTTTAQPASQPGVQQGSLAEVIYQPSDSMEVEQLLSLQPEGSPTLFYARKFIGRPYVGATLEVHDPEWLVVNLRGLDCTTLIETVLALVITQREGGRSFSDYCRTLEKIRYRDGVRGDYILAYAGIRKIVLHGVLCPEGTEKDPGEFYIPDRDRP